MKTAKIFLVSALMLSTCTILNAQGGTTTGLFDWRTDPVKVVQVIFDAAKSGDFGLLPAICDPVGEPDREMRNICDMSNAQNSAQEEFRKYYERGIILSDAAINGTQAKVRVRIDPEGLREAEVTLVNRDSRWFIVSIA